MREINWPLIWQITRRGLWLGFKSGVILGGTLIGGLCVLFVMVLAAAPNFPHDKFWLTAGFVYLVAVTASTVFGLLLGLLLGFYTGILTHIFITYKPASEKYRVVIIWAAFLGCFSWGYILTGSLFEVRSGGEMIGIVLACYGSWISTRLVNFVEDSLFKVKTLPQTEYKVDYTLIYRITRMKKEGLSRFEIDRELLEDGRNAEDLDKAWQILKAREPLPEPAPFKEKTDWNGWGKVAAGALVPIVVVALVCWVV